MIGRIRIAKIIPISINLIGPTSCLANLFIHLFSAQLILLKFVNKQAKLTFLSKRYFAGIIELISFSLFCC